MRLPVVVLGIQISGGFGPENPPAENLDVGFVGCQSRLEGIVGWSGPVLRLAQRNDESKD